MATFSFFTHTSAPSLTSNDDNDAKVTLGTVWRSSSNGQVTSLWVYVGSTNVGGAPGAALIYTGGSWAESPGSQLGRTDFTFQATVGWQEITLSSPITISANTWYIAAIYFGHTQGHAAYTTNYFATEQQPAGTPFTLAHGGGSPNYDIGNGRYAYDNGNGPAYPQNASQSKTNYWIDITFDDLGAGGGGASSFGLTLTSSKTAITTGDTDLTVSATPSGGTSPYSYIWSTLFGSGAFGTPNAASTSYQPTVPGKHVLKCVATDSTTGIGNGYLTLDVAGPVNSITTNATATTTDTLSAQAARNQTLNFTSGGVMPTIKRSFYGHRITFGGQPVNPSVTGPTFQNDNPITVAHKIYIQRTCRLTSIRFYKAPAGAGDYVVAIWQFGNTTPLATKTITLTADNGGWVQVDLDYPLQLTASDTVPYLMSVFIPNGRYANAIWVFAGQETVEYPFRIKEFIDSVQRRDEGAMFGYGNVLTYPTTHSPHTFFIDPLVEWETDKPVYEGGLEYYHRFSASANIDYFPVGIWQPLPPSVAAFKALGFNLVITWGAGFSQAMIDALKAANMHTFPTAEVDDMTVPTAVASDPALNALVKGYLMGDEPDLIAPWRPPSLFQTWYNKLRALDSTKLLYMNFGLTMVLNQGFFMLPVGTTIPEANDNWRKFVAISDIVSVDYYMEDAGNLQGGLFGLWCNPRMVGRMRDLCDESKPVWHYIATTAPDGREPTPQIIYNSTWAALIGGARGIVYFDSKFTAGSQYITDSAMLQASDPAMRNMVQSIITQIQSLKGPLLAKEADLTVSVSSSNNSAGPSGLQFGVPIHYTIRQHNGITYLFTQSIRPGTTTGTFTVPAAANKTITVIGESRTLSANNSGVFSDSYTSDYQVHLYQWA